MNNQGDWMLDLANRLLTRQAMIRARRNRLLYDKQTIRADAESREVALECEARVLLDAEACPRCLGFGIMLVCGNKLFACPVCTVAAKRWLCPRCAGVGRTEDDVWCDEHEIEHDGRCCDCNRGLRFDAKQMTPLLLVARRVLATQEELRA